MVELRAMQADEFRAFLDYFIPDYAAEISANYGRSSVQALGEAKRSIEEDLPQGVDTPGHVLLCLMHPQGGSDMHVGYLWYKLDTEGSSAFIYDFHVFAPYQGKGLGKDALRVLEESLLAQGIGEIKLRVAYDNARAQHVYRESGFRMTGINMVKTLAR